MFTNYLSRESSDSMSHSTDQVPCSSTKWSESHCSFLPHPILYILSSSSFIHSLEYFPLFLLLLRRCPSFGWDGVSFLPSSWYHRIIDHVLDLGWEWWECIVLLCADQCLRLVNDLCKNEILQHLGKTRKILFCTRKWEITLEVLYLVGVA